MVGETTELREEGDDDEDDDETRQSSIHCVMAFARSGVQVHVLRWEEERGEVGGACHPMVEPLAPSTATSQQPLSSSSEDDDGSVVVVNDDAKSNKLTLSPELQQQQQQQQQPKKFRRLPRRLVVLGLLLAVAMVAGIAIAAVSIGSTLDWPPSNKNAASGSSSTTTTNQQRTRGTPSPHSLNIVLLYADDWSWKTLGYMSNGGVQTPHLDKLAQQGVSFTHNCVTTSICWQSRATLYTGVYSSIHQHYNVRDTNMYDKTVHWNQTLYPQLFQAGYQVGFFGKYHAPLPSAYRSSTFDQFRDYWGKHWLERDGQMRHVTDLNKQDAIEFLRSLPARTSATNSNKNNRFALTVSFFATHAWDEKSFPNQYMPMNESEHRYAANFTVPVPLTATQEAWEQMPWFFTESNEGRKRWRLRFDTPDRYQETMKRMYRMATEVDDVVGAIMEELESMGVLNETFIVFTTDNGNFHGEHGLADKWYPHEESIRVPLIVVDPRMPDTARGTKMDELTLSIDLAPTLLRAANLQIPHHMQGRDMSDLYLTTDSNRTTTTTTIAPWRRDFVYEFVQRDFGVTFIPSVYALVNHQYKYMYWPQTGYEQLFDLATDPHEQNDVFNTTESVLVDQIKARYEFLKEVSQRGDPV